MISEYMSKIIGLLFAALIVGGVVFFLRDSEDSWLCSDGAWIKHGSPSASMPTSPCGEGVLNSSRKPTDFVKIGVVVIDNPGQKLSAPYLTYDEPGRSAVQKELLIDEQSVCAAVSGGISCIAMSVDQRTFMRGKRFVVEGLLQGNDIVRVRVIRSVGDTETFLPSVGTTYIPWPEAVKLVENCEVESVMQSHSGKVSIKTKSGEVLAAIEPVIDDVMRVVSKSQSDCGSIVLGTE